MTGLKNRTVTVSKYKMITDEGDGFYAWNGNLYQSDIVRAAIRPKARSIGKATAKHIRNEIQSILMCNAGSYLRT